MTACACEAICQHPRSPGLVQDNEDVIRGGYDPQAIRNDKVTAQLIRNRDLLGGCLSVWRCTRPNGLDKNGVLAQLNDLKPQNSRLAAMFSAKAMDIRALRIKDGASPLCEIRIFCVKDDCKTDENGAWHPDHATIALDEIDGIVWDVEETSYLQAKELLYAKLRSGRIWPNPLDL